MAQFFLDKYHQICILPIKNAVLLLHVTRYHPATKAYIQKHNIYPRLREAIREVVTNQPARPFAFLRDHFAA